MSNVCRTASAREKSRERVTIIAASRPFERRAAGTSIPGREVGLVIGLRSPAFDLRPSGNLIQRRVDVTWSCRKEPQDRHMVLLETTTRASAKSCTSTSNSKTQVQERNERSKQARERLKAKNKTKRAQGRKDRPKAKVKGRSMKSRGKHKTKDRVKRPMANKSRPNGQGPKLQRVKGPKRAKG